MTDARKTIMIIAGEPSGDLHGSGLVTSLKKIEPKLRFIGMGGEKMIKAGFESCQNIDALSVIGLGEILCKLSKFKSVFRLLANKLDFEKPDCVVLIDYPEFNLRFAKEAKKRNIPVIYYISPQIWAWRKGRVKIIKKIVDKMMVIFDFERDFYQNEGIEAEFIGHPLIDAVKTEFSKEKFMERQRLPSEKKILAILPGSRPIEVIRNLPAMAGASRLINEKFNGKIQSIIAKPKEIAIEIYEKILRESGAEAKIIENYPYDCINAADFVLVASGTATLETAILEKPMVIVYKVSFLTWLIGKMLVKIPYIGLVNIVAGKKIVPELIQFEATPRNIADTAISLLSSPEKLSEIKFNLRSIKKKLGDAGASERAAKTVLEMLRCL